MEKIKKVVRRMVPAMMLAFFMSVFMPVARVNAAETERIASTRDGYVNIVYSEGSSTGVTDVDSALTNLKTLIVGIVRVFGGIHHQVRHDPPEGVPDPGGGRQGGDVHRHPRWLPSRLAG